MNPRPCYRYRTAVLVGPWRAEPETALNDAIRAGQAAREEGGDVDWRVAGEIEEGIARLSEAPDRAGAQATEARQGQAVFEGG